MAEPSTLRADCRSCFGLCCVATSFGRSADFAIDKPAGVPCLHLADDRADDRADDFGCTIHDELRPRGFAGCTTYDCFGAGQQVAQRTYAGTHWREAPQTAAQMFRVFATMRVLHELLWLLTEAVALEPSGPQQDALVAASRATRERTEASPEELDRLDVDAHRDTVVPLLRQASERARRRHRVPGPDLGGADLAGQDLRGTDLTAASLRGALLVGADLRGTDLHLADLTGADLRGADLRGADLASTLFLSQFQVNAARGDQETRVPGALDRPPHWS